MQLQLQQFRHLLFLVSFENFCHLYMRIVFRCYSSLPIWSFLIDFSSLNDSINKKIVKNEINNSINAHDPINEVLNI